MRLPRLPRRGGASPADGPRAHAHTEDADAFAQQRARMVTEQLEARGIRDDDVLDAFRAVPRHAFVDGDDPYGDRALPIEAGQTISQPYVVARMTVTARPPGPDGFRSAEIL